jgi:hypothetical protein
VIGNITPLERIGSKKNAQYPHSLFASQTNSIQKITCQNSPHPSNVARYQSHVFGSDPSVMRTMEQTGSWSPEQNATPLYLNQVSDRTINKVSQSIDF